MNTKRMSAAFIIGGHAPCAAQEPQDQQWYELARQHRPGRRQGAGGENKSLVPEGQQVPTHERGDSYVIDQRAVVIGQIGLSRDMRVGHEKIAEAVLRLPLPARSNTARTLLHKSTRRC